MGKVLVLAFAYVDGRWVVFDVARQVLFRDRAGVPASVEQLVDNPDWVDQQTAGILPEGLPYSAFISRRTLMPFQAPKTLRPQLQQPWLRLRYEFRRAIGWEREPAR